MPVDFSKVVTHDEYGEELCMVNECEAISLVRHRKDLQIKIEYNGDEQLIKLSSAQVLELAHAMIEWYIKQKDR